MIELLVLSLKTSQQHTGCMMLELFFLIKRSGERKPFGFQYKSGHFTLLIPGCHQ